MDTSLSSLEYNSAHSQVIHAQCYNTPHILPNITSTGSYMLHLNSTNTLRDLPPLYTDGFQLEPQHETVLACFDFNNTAYRFHPFSNPVNFSTDSTALPSIDRGTTMPEIYHPQELRVTVVRDPTTTPLTTIPNHLAGGSNDYGSSYSYMPIASYPTHSKIPDRFPRTDEGGYGATTSEQHRGHANAPQLQISEDVFGLDG